MSVFKAATLNLPLHSRSGEPATLASNAMDRTAAAHARWIGQSAPERGWSASCAWRSMLQDLASNRPANLSEWLVIFGGAVDLGVVVALLIMTFALSTPAVSVI